MFDHHATTDFASRITHPHIQTTSNQSFRHHTNEKYAQKQHKMANLEVESDRLKKHQTPPHQQKTRNQQHKMAYKPQKRYLVVVAEPVFGHEDPCRRKKGPGHLCVALLRARGLTGDLSTSIVRDQGSRDK
ncbi:hypothetical protein QEV65_03170 [Trueperella pyogenes]|uniref:hypothetical protein n=1 Tax=Trueperella pyogenes TaxID=1661 RepID=UPI003250A8AD